MKRILVAAVALCFLSPASADVFKCKGPDGKFAYQDVPCAGATREEPLSLDVDDPSDREVDRARQRAIRDSMRAEEIDGEYERKRRLGRLEYESTERDKDRQRERCERYITRAERAERRAGGDRYSDRLREEYRRDARELRERHFSECR